MILPIVLMTVQFRIAQVQPEQRTIPIVSDEHGILSFGDPFEQNETIQEQSPNYGIQQMDELPLSANFFQYVDLELSLLHASQPQTIKSFLTDQDIESLSNNLSQPVYTFMGRARQQEVPPTLYQDAVVMDSNIMPVDTDLGTLLAYGDLGPLSVDDINIEPLSSDTDMELFFNDTFQFGNLLMADEEHHSNTSDPLASLKTPAILLDSSSGKARNFDGIRDGSMAFAAFNGSACEHSFEIVQSIAGQSFVQSGNAKHSIVNLTSQKHFQCNTCTMQLRTSSDYLRHQRTHTGEKPFKCDFCQKEFSDCSSCQRHRRLHTGEKPFQCDICQKQFRASGNCQTHQRLHTGEKPFQCDICQKQFRTAGNYQTHRRLHTGEKPFQCDICQKQFRTAGHCQTHRRIHTAEKLFKCDFCQKEFSDRSNYKTHRRVHTGEKPFLCDICQKQFRTPGNYQRHRKIHTGEKRFQCEICAKQFSTSDNCQRHRRIHTGEKLFLCEEIARNSSIALEITKHIN